VIENLLRCKAIPEITKLLTSEHALMQMEAVNALTVGGGILLGGQHTSAMENYLVEADLAEKIKLLLQFSGLSPQLLENLVTMTDTLSKYGEYQVEVCPRNRF